MTRKWLEVIELNGSADQPQDALEGAEEYKDRWDGESWRVVVVEETSRTTDESYRVFVEESVESDAVGGWVAVGEPADPTDDGEVFISAVEDLRDVDGDDMDRLRVVMDYTNGEQRLEAWVEPE